jgi:hypothetical protein
MTRSPFPLQWPDGVARTRFRDNSRFDKGRGFNAARDGALYELERFNASHVVITSNLPTTARGLPHATSAGHLPDPGIAVWWIKRGREHVIACDRWTTVTENMRAIERTLEALRGVERWGTKEMVETAFAGFAALPPGSGTDAYMAPEQKRDLTWHEIFNVSHEPWKNLPKADLLAVVRARHRDMIKAAHPDRGGNTGDAAALNAALDAAERDLKE